MYSCTVNRQSQIVAYWPATFAAKNGTLTIKRREKGEHTWAEVLIKLSELIGMVWYGIFGQKYNTYNQVYTSICSFIWIRLREASPPFLVSVCHRTIKDTLLKGVLNLAILTIFTVLYYMAHASTFGIPRKKKCLTKFFNFFWLNIREILGNISIRERYVRSLGSGGFLRKCLICNILEGKFRHFW